MGIRIPERVPLPGTAIEKGAESKSSMEPELRAKSVTGFRIRNSTYRDQNQKQGLMEWKYRDSKIDNGMPPVSTLANLQAEN
ncbi:hypothetical protein EVAR_58150_1 [Eumeta japonica]|uniref:Uncharacterized protein n=1 Tax=Eumeta variegata TaxID=151549 RepID=A0A4C1X183_EUMVA|nr:hypothetical protein EVAR_58150_1 [Eumeta japonica]